MYVYTYVCIYIHTHDIFAYVCIYACDSGNANVHFGIECIYDLFENYQQSAKKSDKLRDHEIQILYRKSKRTASNYQFIDRK